MTIECPICDSGRLAIRKHVYTYPLLQCDDCGAQFLNPQPDDAVLGAIYNEDYFLADTPEAKVEFYKLKTATACLYLNQLQGFLRTNDVSILEIGCGMGDFLLEAQSKGYDVRGIEISEYATNIANHRLGSKRVINGVLAEDSFVDHSFDVIVFFDVIEHVRNFKRFLYLVNKYLKPEGLVYMVTPSLDSWSARMLGKRWMEYKLEHLFYFNQKSIRILLEMTGFKNVFFFSNNKVMSVNYIKRHFVRFPVPIITPIVRLFEAVIPKRLAAKPFRIVASGMMVLAEKAPDYLIEG